MFHSPLRSRIDKPRFGMPGCAVFALMTLAMSGCGPHRAKAVDLDVAKGTLVQVLDHWQSGGTIDELRDRSPEVVVQEAAWANGQRLENYTVLSDGRAEDANWFCEVELSLVPKEGAPTEKKKVTYVVGTDPVLTVFRAIL